MSKYINEDREAVKSTFQLVLNTMETVAKDESTAEDIITATAKCLKAVEALSFELQHTGDVSESPDKVDLSQYNITGESIVKAHINAMLSDLKDSVNDLSWVESVEEFTVSQKAAKGQLEELAKSDNEAVRAQAEEGLRTLSATFPADDTPEWVVRRMRNACVLMGIVSNLQNILISAAKL